MPIDIHIVRNWDHLPAAAPVESTMAKAALGWPMDTTLVVHTGNMGVKQGLENVVDAARLADERRAPVQFVLIGDGCQGEKLMARARGISRLTLVDTLSDEDYHLPLSEADVLLVNEMQGVASMAVPSKLTSYFHAGRPVLAATDPHGICAEEVLASGAGVVVPANEPGTLLDTVRAFARDTETAEAFGVNGKVYRAEVLDEVVVIEQWAALVACIMATGRERGRQSMTNVLGRPRNPIAAPLSTQYPPAS